MKDLGIGELTRGIGLEGKEKRTRRRDWVLIISLGVMVMGGAGVGGPGGPSGDIGSGMSPAGYGGLPEVAAEVDFGNLAGSPPAMSLSEAVSPIGEASQAAGELAGSGSLMGSKFLDSLITGLGANAPPAYGGSNQGNFSGYGDPNGPGHASNSQTSTSVGFLGGEPPSGGQSGNGPFGTGGGIAGSIIGGIATGGNPLGAIVGGLLGDIFGGMLGGQSFGQTIGQAGLGLPRAFVGAIPFGGGIFGQAASMVAQGLMGQGMQGNFGEAPSGGIASGTGGGEPGQGGPGEVIAPEAHALAREEQAPAAQQASFSLSPQPFGWYQPGQVYGMKRVNLPWVSWPAAQVPYAGGNYGGMKRV